MRLSVNGMSDVECRVGNDGLAGLVPAGGMGPVAGDAELGIGLGS